MSTEERWPQVRETAKVFKTLREENHFFEAISEIMVRRGGSLR